MPDTSKTTTTEEKTSTATPPHEDHMEHAKTDMEHAKNAIKGAVEKVVDKLPGRDHAAH